MKAGWRKVLEGCADVASDVAVIVLTIVLAVCLVALLILVGKLFFFTMVRCGN